MARKSITELEAQANATIEDNSTGSVSPADVRAMFKDFLNAIRPAYGVLQKTAPQTVTLGTAALPISYTSQNDSDVGETNSSPANGTITRSERGTSTINFTMDIECVANRFITATLYKDNAATPWRTTMNGAGAGNPVGMSLTAIDYADPAAVYDVRLSAEQDNVSTIISNGAFLLAIDPVNSYT